MNAKKENKNKQTNTQTERDTMIQILLNGFSGLRLKLM